MTVEFLQPKVRLDSRIKYKPKTHQNPLKQTGLASHAPTCVQSMLD